MIKPVKEKKLIYKLVVLSLITTPLFAILGGTPFFRFNFKEISDFLPGIYFTATITILFWFINITLLFVAEKIVVIKNILVRGMISIGLALAIVATGFYLYTPKNPSQPMRIAMANPAFGKMREQLFFKNNSSARQPGDSNFKVFNPVDFNTDRPKFFFFPMALRLLTIDLIILTLCELVFLYFRKRKIENENVHLRQMNLEAKNNQLKMQLHPHFLFNSLNTLRLLLKKDTDKAEDYLLKLSDILRYSTTAALHNVVEIEDELKLCMSYLEMQKVRFNDMLHFSVTNPDLYAAKGKVPVYSLQLLAENAIKHNALTNEEPLTVFIDYDAAGKTITVRNKFQPKRTFMPTTMTGLSNLDKRYKLLNAEGITISQGDDEFSVTINIL